jgi:hypothetical protein
VGVSAGRWKLEREEGIGRGLTVRCNRKAICGTSPPECRIRCKDWARTGRSSSSSSIRARSLRSRLLFSLTGLVRFFSPLPPPLFPLHLRLSSLHTRSRFNGVATNSPATQRTRPSPSCPRTSTSPPRSSPTCPRARNTSSRAPCRGASRTRSHRGRRSSGVIRSLRIACWISTSPSPCRSSAFPSREGFLVPPPLSLP